MTKVLIIGGTGFFGYHLIKEAKKRNWKVTSISKKSPKKSRFHKNVNYKLANFENLRSLKKIITKDFDYVINAGGYGNHPDFGKAGKKLFNSHFLGTVNLTKIFLNKKIKKFVQIGSSAEYGKCKSPIRENANCSPNTPYGQAKYVCSNYLQSLSNSSNFPATILRFFLVYGPRQDLNRLIPQVIINSLKNKNFPITKGDQYCDFCYIDDAVKATFLTLLSKNTNGEIINIGSGKPTKVKKIVQRLCKLIGKGRPLFGKLKYKSGINKNLYPKIMKAKKILNWSPKFNLDEGLKITINSYL